MKRKSQTDPRLYFAVCVPPKKSAAGAWRVQKFDGLCLQTGGTAMVGIDGKKFRSRQNSLIFIRKGVRCGFWKVPGSKPPTLWTVAFHCPSAFYDYLPHLSGDNPKKLMWKLTPKQAGIFKAFFVRLVRAEKDSLRTVKTSAWLMLLLGTIEHWASKSSERGLPGPLE